VARLDAQASVRWRLDMWQVVLPEVPHYLFLGKGYTLNPTDLYLMGQSMRRGLARDYESSLLAGDYHNGPLSILIPFGIFGMLAVLLFLIAGGSALINHYKYGHPSLKLINSFLLAAFLTRVVWFFVFFGGISSDLYYFAGLVGLSVSLNGGLRRKEPSPQLVSNQITPEHGRPGIAPA